MIAVADEQSLLNQLSVNRDRDVVVLFYSSWCPFCRRFRPVFEKYAEKAGSVVFMEVQLDEDENPMWETYSLESVPSIILFKNGQVSRRLDCERGIGLNETKFSQWLKTS